MSLKKETLINASVHHKVFGDGNVIEVSEELVTINFPQHGDKSFVYPDAFGTFLKLNDQRHKDLVLEDVDTKKEEDDQRIENAMKAHKEYVEQTKEAAKKKRKATSTKRKTTTKKATTTKKTTTKKTPAKKKTE